MNRLGQATSPYLLQHKDNPVDWYEWGPEAFAEARRRDVPVFLSIGYSSCHWCHVMAHESFEDERLAARLNEHFVSVKVDREERPDIDAIYMEATMAMTGSGGWPMTVFLDHDQRPFYAGTYFPPEPRHGSPSLSQLLEAITEAWTSRRLEIEMAASRLTEALQMNAGVGVAGVDIDEAVVVFALQQLRQQFDWTRGGFGGAPKFPPSMVLEFLLREAARTGNPDALEMAERTLEAMARGGVYDQLGGGFARYSVDADWVVPHFEKMLYDNALLLRVYAHWWRLTGSSLAEQVVRGTAAFLLDELRTPDGGFAASLDADTADGEGSFYVWSPAQLREALSEEDAAWTEQLLDVSTAGSFERGRSTLQMRADPTDEARWQRIRQALMRARSLRARPGRDDKLVAAWNGLAIAAIAECGSLFAEPQWVDAAEKAARLLLCLHVSDELGVQVLRTSKDGVAGSSPGVLEDYANLAEGLLALAQVTGEDLWTEQAGRLLDAIVLRFSSAEGGFQRTAADAEPLIVRPRELADNAEPSGWAAAAHAMLTFAARTGSNAYRERALAALAPLAQVGTTAPRAAGWALAACSAVLDGPAEITVAAPVGHALHALALRATAPGAVVIVKAGQPATAMVCRHRTCTLPTGDAAELATHIGALR